MLNRFATAGSRVLRLASWPIAQLLVLLVWLYQRTLSPVVGPCCRFAPSCSEYAIVCLRKYGLIKALAKTVWRLARCQPLCRGGCDAP